MNPRNFPAGPSLNRGDIVVFLGDFGLLWSSYSAVRDSECLRWLSGMPWVSLVIDGNHENFDALDALPVEDRFGAPAGVFTPGVYHLKRGYVYDLWGVKCFVFGGAASIDKDLRTPGLDWWSRELPNREETERGFKSLEACGWKVDYVFTHAAPARALEVLKRTMPDLFPSGYDDIRDPVGEYLDILADKLSFRSWHFGHYHGESPLFEGGASGLFRGEYNTVRSVPDIPGEGSLR